MVEVTQEGGKKRVKKVKRKVKKVKRLVKKTSASNTPTPSSSGFLSQISTTPVQTAMSLFLYGPPGIGKTSFGAYMKKPIFVIHPEEQGINDLKNYGLVPADLPVLEIPEDSDSGWDNLISILEELATYSHGHESLIIDSLTWIEDLCFQECCKNEYKNDWSSEGFLSFQSGPDTASKNREYWPRFLRALSEVRKKGIDILLLAHSTIKPYNNPEGPDYDHFIPTLHKKIFERTNIWAECVLFMNYNIDIDKSGIKNKAKDSYDRYLYTDYSPVYDAKNRYDLPPWLEMGESGEEAWKNFYKEVKKRRKV